MNKGIFITGTDTGVGKTFIICGLLRTFNKMGINTCPMKPVETGCKARKNKLVPADTVKLIRASGTNESMDLINPYRLKHPLAPAVSAELEGVKIQKKIILSAYKSLLNKYDITLVEGAGGIMVPVYKNYLIIDLIKDMDVPLIIVARPGLGTINHSLLTIKAAREKGINIKGVIINHAAKAKKGLAKKTNSEVIEKLGKVSVLGIVPYSGNAGASVLKMPFLKIAEKIY